MSNKRAPGRSLDEWIDLSCRKLRPFPLSSCSWKGNHRLISQVNLYTWKYILLSSSTGVWNFFCKYVIEGFFYDKIKIIIGWPFIMAREKKPVHRVQMTEGKRNIIHQLLEEYDIQTVAFCSEWIKKPGCKRHPDPLCRRAGRDQRSHRGCLPQNRISTLYCPSSKKYPEICSG